ncbi:MAG: DUF6142 family protein [Suipraeoptans sp.]
MKKKVSKLEKRRRKLVKTKYGQERIENARGGAKSLILGILVVLILSLSLLLSFYTQGDVGVIIGIIGLIAIYTSVYGIYYAVKGFKERNKKYLLCKIGIALNSILLLVFILLFIRGLI